MEGKRIVIIDDDQDIIDLMKIIFESAQAEVFTAGGGREGLRLLWSARPNLVILDIMMRDMSGWQTCRRIRELTDVPIMFYTVLDHEEHIVRGLSMGADDFVIKPEKPSILLARAGSLLKRSQADPEDSSFIYDDGYLRIDLERKRIDVEGQPINLTPTEFALLRFLATNRGHICSMEQIENHVWKNRGDVEARTVHVFICQLRKKIEPDPHHPSYIRSEYGMGYRFE